MTLDQDLPKVSRFELSFQIVQVSLILNNLGLIQSTLNLCQIKNVQSQKLPRHSDILVGVSFFRSREHVKPIKTMRQYRLW